MFIILVLKGVFNIYSYVNSWVLLKNENVRLVDNKKKWSNSLESNEKKIKMSNWGFVIQWKYN